MVCKRISLRVACIPNEYSSRTEEYLRDLLAELRILNPLFVRMSYFGGMLLLKYAKIYVYDKSIIYLEEEENFSLFIILYGRVLLRTK